MAKEELIRRKAKNKLTDNGWNCWIPSSQRYGAGITYQPDDHNRGDDIFNVFDLIGWKEDEIIFVQYTTENHIRAREKKIHEQMAELNIWKPPNCRIEVWGYADGEGFTKTIEI